MTTSTDIANLALAHLGNAPITDITEATEPARAAQLFYEPVRRAVLRSHRWNFATKRAVLTELDEEPLFGWERQFQLPSDYLRVVEVNDSEHGDNLTDPFIIEGQKLLTDAETVNLVYVYDCTNVSIFDPLFVDAFSIRLAVKLCDTLRGASQQAERLMVEYDRITGPLARRIDANEGRRRKGLITKSSPMIRARTLGLDQGVNDYPEP